MGSFVFFAKIVAWTACVLGALITSVMALVAAKKPERNLSLQIIIGVLIILSAIFFLVWQTARDTTNLRSQFAQERLADFTDEFSRKIARVGNDLNKDFYLDKLSAQQYEEHLKVILDDWARDLNSLELSFGSEFPSSELLALEEVVKSIRSALLMPIQDAAKNVAPDGRPTPINGALFIVAKDIVHQLDIISRRLRVE